jgi:hypothetical protein
MSFVYLALYVLLISFVFSAVSGIIMFFVDMIRFGTPHKRFETVSSIEKYNQQITEMEKEIEQTENVQPVEIDL